MCAKKGGIPDEGIRLRPYYEPFMDGDKPGEAYTVTDEGEVKIESLEEVHDIRDVTFMRAMAHECRTWRTPNFTKEVEEYYRIFNRHLSKQREEGFSARDSFLKEVLSEIHDNIVEYLRTFIFFDDYRIYDVAAAFAIHSFFKHQMPMCPILLVEGLYGTGKSTFMKLLSRISYRGHLSGNYSCPVLIDLLGKYDCTILLDEAKDNLSSERGNEINNFLKLATERSGTYDRMRVDREGVLSGTSSSYFTDVAVCTLGGFREDTRSRGILIGTPVVNEKVCEDLDFMEIFDEFDFHNDPRIISAKLYALKAITEVERIKGHLDNADSPGVSFRRSLKTAHDLLSSGKYGEEEGITEHPSVQNRSLKVICGYYAISRYSGHSMDLLEYLLECERKKKKDKSTGQYGIVVQALCEAIVFGKTVTEYDALPPPIDYIAFVNGCHNLRLKDITEWALFDIMNSDDSSCRLSIDRGTVAFCLDRLKIPIKEGAGRYKCLDDDWPEFYENLLVAIGQYGAGFREVFSRVQSNPQSEKVMKVKVVKSTCKNSGGI